MFIAMVAPHVVAPHVDKVPTPTASNSAKGTFRLLFSHCAKSQSAQFDPEFKILVSSNFIDMTKHTDK